MPFSLMGLFRVKRNTQAERDLAIVQAELGCATPEEAVQASLRQTAALGKALRENREVRILGHNPNGGDVVLQA